MWARIYLLYGFYMFMYSTFRVYTWKQLEPYGEPKERLIVNTLKRVSTEVIHAKIAEDKFLLGLSKGLVSVLSDTKI